MKPQVYKDERPAEYFTRFYKRTQTRRPDWMYEIVRIVLTPLLLFFYRTRCIDSDKVPADGPAIIAPNHFSFLDHFYVAVYLRRKVHFMAKSQLFARPMQFVYTHGGVFPVRRGQRDEESFKTAHAVLARGDIVGSEKVRNWKKLQFPKITVQYGDPIQFEQVDDPSKEVAQAASVVIFDQVKALYYPLRKEGRKTAVQAARAARAGSPVTPSP